MSDDTRTADDEETGAGTLAHRAVAEQERLIGAGALSLFLRQRVREEVHRFHIAVEPSLIGCGDHADAALLLRRVGKLEPPCVRERGRLDVIAPEMRALRLATRHLNVD